MKTRTSLRLVQLCAAIPFNSWSKAGRSPCRSRAISDVTSPIPMPRAQTTGPGRWFRAASGAWPLLRAEPDLPDTAPLTHAHRCSRNRRRRVPPSSGPGGARPEELMTPNTRERRLHAHLALAAALMAAACGGGENRDAAPATVVVLDIERFESTGALAGAAASERGAPGEAEAVLYRLRGGAGAAAAAQAEQLRALGFHNVEAE